MVQTLESAAMPERLSPEEIEHLARPPARAQKGWYLKANL